MSFRIALRTGAAVAALMLAPPLAGAVDTKSQSGAPVSHPSIVVTSDYLLSANEIIGQAVYGASGRELATVDDIIVTGSDHVILAVLSVGGFLGINDQLVAIPFERLSIGEVGIGVAGLTEKKLSEMTEVSYRDSADDGLYRNRYMSRMDRTMNRWSVKIGNAYEASADKAKEGASVVSKETSQAWDQTQAAFLSLKTATGETWNDARVAFEQALEDLEKGWDRAVD